MPPRSIDTTLTHPNSADSELREVIIFKRKSRVNKTIFFSFFLLNTSILGAPHPGYPPELVYQHWVTSSQFDEPHLSQCSQQSFCHLPQTALPEFQTTPCEDSFLSQKNLNTINTTQQTFESLPNTTPEDKPLPAQKMNTININSHRTTMDVTGSFDEIEKAAKQGNVAAQLQIGEIYIEGFEVSFRMTWKRLFSGWK